MRIREPQVVDPPFSGGIKLESRQRPVRVPELTVGLADDVHAQPFRAASPPVESTGYDDIIDLSRSVNTERSVSREMSATLGDAPGSPDTPATPEPANAQRLGAGRPLDPSIRRDMEATFGCDLSAVRIHDDSTANESARALDARAYAVGSDIVFAAGQYRPESAEGRVLLAHELAHTIQQVGARPLSAEARPQLDGAVLEREAELAALAAVSSASMPRLSRVGAAVVLRSGNTSSTSATAPAATSDRLPPGMTVNEDDPPGKGTTKLVVNVHNFTLPLEKGAGSWVQGEYDRVGKSGGLVFTPLFKNGHIGAYKEGDTAEHQSIWLLRSGFASAKTLSEGFKSSTNPEVIKDLNDPAVKKVIDNIAIGLSAAGCDIDHIVEKQLGGTSIPENLQLLTSKKNQDSGRHLRVALVNLVRSIRDPGMRGPGVTNLQLRFPNITVPLGSDDASSKIEKHLRDGRVSGTTKPVVAASTTSVLLLAGGRSVTVNVQKSGKTPVAVDAKRLIPGMKLVTYERAKKKGSTTDKIEAELHSDTVTAAVEAKGGTNATVHLNAALMPPATNGPTAAVAAPTAECRNVTLQTPHPAVAFFYPYLSPGRLTTLALDERGLTGSGTIFPTVRILGKLQIDYGPDTLALKAPIDATRLKSPHPYFRFVGGQLALELAPDFVPSGRLHFEVGPKGRPMLLGALDASAEGGALVLTGTLTPGRKIPGVTAVQGTVRYHSKDGWSGSIAATSSAIPNSTANVELGFKSGKKGDLVPYASGGITTKIRDTELFLKAVWDGADIGYEGGVTLKKPIRGVEAVRLTGGYKNGSLSLSGETDLTWKSFTSKIRLQYTRKDGEVGRLAGLANLKIKTPKVEGAIELHVNDVGVAWGKGSLSYRISEDIRPTLGVELTPQGRVKMSGEVALGAIKLSRGISDRIPLLRDVGVKFSVPTPVPGITAYGQIQGSLALGYGVGPATLTGIVFRGEIYPFEDDPKIKAALKGVFNVPAYGALLGSFGASIGAELALGAVGVKGGIDVSPSLRISGEAGLAVSAAYASGGFSFAAEAFAEGEMLASLDVDLSAKIYAVWGFFSHTWTYPLSKVSRRLGPRMRLDLGKVAYSSEGGITWPNLSQIRLSPETIDPLDIVKDLLRGGEAKKV